jgi:transposase
MLMVDGEGTPLSAFVTDAATSEVQSIETLVDERMTSRTPKRLLYDKAADSDSLRESLQLRGILLLCPHRENRTKASANDGRVMRRYKRRYKVERSLSWLYNCRRLITRWEYYPELFQSFVHLACLLTILKGF